MWFQNPNCQETTWPLWLHGQPLNWVSCQVWLVLCQHFSRRSGQEEPSSKIPHRFPVPTWYGGCSKGMGIVCSYRQTRFLFSDHCRVCAWKKRRRKRQREQTLLFMKLEPENWCRKDEEPCVSVLSLFPYCLLPTRNLNQTIWKLKTPQNIWYISYGDEQCFDWSRQQFRSN